MKKKKLSEEELNAKITADTRQLADEGRLVDAGFQYFIGYTYPDRQSLEKEHIIELRDAYLNGADFLFRMLTVMLIDVDAGPGEDELRRIDSVDDELEDLMDEFLKRHNLPTRRPPGGYPRD